MNVSNSLPKHPPEAQLTRRAFLKNSSTAVVASSIALERAVFAAAGDDTIKIALVGCGGRGRGAANQALSTPGKTKLVALADVRPEQLQQGLNDLKVAHADQIDVPPDHQFTEFDGYKSAISLADVVVLATSPGFRPIHFEEAVRQGKHVFMEKPVATDAPGVHRVLAAAEQAKQKNLKIGVGLQRRHKPGYIEAVKRIQDGALGDLFLLRCYWDGGSRDGVERMPGEKEMHYQIRNWYYFTWLSGDHIVEQHVHNIDVVNWIKGAYPIRGQGMGGRQVRNAKRHGQIFDHHFVEFEYADGTRMISQCRQIPGCWPNISEHALGTKGEADLNNDRNIFAIKPAKGGGGSQWRFSSNKKIDAYQQEHDDLFDAIRNNKPYNEAEHGALSTMTGIMGRMCTYSGQQIEWDTALNSKGDTLPTEWSWDATPPILPDADGWYPIARPGKPISV